MLELCRSNRVESLLDVMAEQIRRKPLASPFTAETLVIPSPAMARWTRLELARKHGVAAHYDSLQPASFVWQLARRQLGDLPERDPLERDPLTWKIFTLLPAMLSEPPFWALRQYLREDESAVMRLQLAQRIADVFDRYQYYRPELIQKWDSQGNAGGDVDWQAGLWQRINRDLENKGLQNRVAIIQALITHLSNCDGGGLPERVNIFAVSSLPPLFIQVFLTLARHCEIHFYLHSPTDQFWADLVTQKQLARLRLEKPDEADLWEVANPLLASWGRQGQALQDLLLQHDVEMREIDAFIPPGHASILDRLQMDLFELKGGQPENEPEIIKADDSVQLHVCHSAQRECQVLHDRLLTMLDSGCPDAISGLRPEDILVMVPEISSYAPYIEAAFEQTPGDDRPFIPWNLSDTTIRDEHPLVQVFFALLKLANSRFSQSDVLSFLDVPEVARQFNLDKPALGRIRQWIEQARVNWGLDSAHKSRLGLPQTEQNSWAQAEQRLFGGYALDAGTLFGDIAPIPGIDSAGGEILGRFWRLLSLLQDYSRRLVEERSAFGWQKFLGRMLNDFFGEQNDEDGRLQKIRDALADFAEQAGNVQDPLSIELVKHWMDVQLGTESRHGRYFSGGVTFCGMLPMRSLPFKVICLLGMNDSAFPGRNQYTEFDLMRRNWRPGDPRKGDEDRYLFLETLLCARKCLYISYTGRDIRKNSERQPSLLVRELLDYINQRYCVESVGPESKTSDKLSCTHPLQPFSPRNYTGDSRSYDPYWCGVARSIITSTQPAAGSAPRLWNDTALSLAADSMRQLTLSQLLRFVRHPVRYFAQTRLQLYLYDEEAGEDDEIFELDALQAYHLKRRLLEDELDGRELSVRHLAAEGALPHGPTAGAIWAKTTADLSALRERIARFVPERPEPRLIHLELLTREGTKFELSGQVRHFYPGMGILHYTPGRLKGRDVLSLWIEHLACRAMEIEDHPASFLYGASESFELAAEMSPVQARESLSHFLQHYWAGLQRPLLILPRASYDFVKTEQSGRRADPFNAARTAWNGNGYQGIPGDKDDAYIQLVRRGMDESPLDHPDFVSLARDFYGTVLSAGFLT